MLPTTKILSLFQLMMRFGGNATRFPAEAKSNLWIVSGDFQRKGSQGTTNQQEEDNAFQHHQLVDCAWGWCVLRARLPLMLQGRSRTWFRMPPHPNSHRQDCRWTRKIPRESSQFMGWHGPIRGEWQWCPIHSGDKSKKEGWWEGVQLRWGGYSEFYNSQVDWNHSIVCGEQYGCGEGDNIGGTLRPNEVRGDADRNIRGLFKEYSIPLSPGLGPIKAELMEISIDLADHQISKMTCIMLYLALKLSCMYCTL